MFDVLTTVSTFFILGAMDKNVKALFIGDNYVNNKEDKYVIIEMI